MESLRRWVRDAIGYRSVLYRLAAYCLDVFHVLKREGLRGLVILRMAKTKGPDVWLQLRCLKFPFLVRRGSDDIGSVVNNVLREEYGQMPTTFDPKVIVDAGAYVGDTSAYFLSRFPLAQVIALEPNDESYARASLNLAPYGSRVELLKRALWDSETMVRMSGEQTGSSISANGAEVQTETIPALMDRLGFQRIDLLKMDIEGAEATVLPSGRGGWLRKVRMILLETHGAEIERQVLPLLAAEGFSCKRHRNVWYCRSDERNGTSAP